MANKQLERFLEIFSECLLVPFLKFGGDQIQYEIVIVIYEMLNFIKYLYNFSIANHFL